MKPIAIAPRDMLARKPAHGAPCNSCGLCCVAIKCDLARRLFGAEPGPCPALVSDDRVHWQCGVVLETSGPNFSREMHDAARLIVRAGEGCDARFNGEKVNTKFHAQCAQADALRAEAIQEAREMWGIQP